MAERLPLISALDPGALKTPVQEPTAVSRSARPALGGVVTQVVKLPDGRYAAQGPGWTRFAPTFAAALQVARKGPQEAAADAS